MLHTSQRKPEAHNQLRKGIKMMSKRVDHVEIVPRNAENTIDFYVNILGFRTRSRNEVKMPPMRAHFYVRH